MLLKGRRKKDSARLLTIDFGEQLSRPPEVEGEAANRAIMIADQAGVPLYVVHVSCKEAIDPIAQARTNDWHAWGETCTQYLFIDETALDQPDFEGAKYVYTPPPRPKANQVGIEPPEEGRTERREEVRREVAYDADNPEAGLTVKQTPLPKTNP
mgnify:CR=1 FL=1